MDVYLQWIFDIMMSSERVSHAESTNTCIMSITCLDFTEL